MELLITQKEIKRNNRRIDNEEISIFRAIMVYIDMFSTCNSIALMSWNNKAFGLVRVESIFHHVTLLSCLLQLVLIRKSLSFGHCIEIIVWGAAIFADRPKGLLLICLARFMWYMRSAIKVLTKRGEAKTVSLQRDIRLSEDSLKDMETDMTCIKHSSQTETDLREKAERILQSYKDELETVDEALRIAASEHVSIVIPLEGEKEKNDEIEHATSKRVVVHDDGSFEWR